jgi:16S rRNA (uracil1498-N3)-methyltransferase
VTRGPAGTGAAAHVFVDALDDECEISGDDGHHLQKVRRLTVGEIVTAADGSGSWRSYAVSGVAAGRLSLHAVDAARFVPEPAVAVVLAVALTKGGLDDVVTAATELGVERVIPVRTERVVVRWDEARAVRAVTRLRAIAREASMQSRRVRIPVVDDVTALSTLRECVGLVIADPAGADVFDLARPLAENAGRAKWTVLVGPEGGFSAKEDEMFAKVPRLRLAPNVLRAVTAPVAAVAVLVQAAGRMGPELPLSE